MLDEVSEESRVIGIDSASTKYWVGVTNDQQAYLGRTVEDLVSAADVDGRLAVIAIDIPIGLPLVGARQADVAARLRVGPRRGSVFMTPIRSAIEAKSLAEANEVSRGVIGKGVSAQSFALARKILEVDRFVRNANRTVIEVHPEVSFRELAGYDLESKHTWAGIHQRQRLLAKGGMRIQRDLGEAGRVAGIDDILDAAVAAWTAKRFHAGDASCIPDIPEDFGDGGPTGVIWV